MPPDVVHLTQQLVRIPSVNPMGRAVEGPIYLEGRVTDFLQQWATELGLAWERLPVLPGRDNLVVRLESRGDAAISRRTVMLEVHQDTVPTEGMTVPAFDADYRDGRIYGRGACDVKGGMATMMSALRHLVETDMPHPTVLLAFTINEENGFDGVRHLCQTWSTGCSRLMPGPPDLAVVAEPTELNVVIAHKGAVRWKCHTLGHAVHSSNPAAGENAIYAMQPVIEVLQSYAAEVLRQAPSHQLLGQPTLSVGTIQGGLSVNTVPDRCTIEIDRRVLPEESPEEAYDHVCRYLAERLKTNNVRIQHDPPFLRSPGLASGPNHRLAECLSVCARQQGASGDCLGVPFGTDAGHLAAAGVPAVVFGPGSIRQAHTRDEWIDCRQLEQAVEILIRFCLEAHLAHLAHPA